MNKTISHWLFSNDDMKHVEMLWTSIFRHVSGCLSTCPRRVGLWPSYAHQYPFTNKLYNRYVDWRVSVAYWSSCDKLLIPIVYSYWEIFVLFFHIYWWSSYRFIYVANATLFHVTDEIKDETQEIHLNNFVGRHMCTIHETFLYNC
jgi:hypothetical protein